MRSNNPSTSTSSEQLEQLENRTHPDYVSQAGAKRMRATGTIGFSFRERMAGPLAAGTDDPVLGAARGRAARTQFVADLRVTIDDLAACIRDPQHPTRLQGTATFPGLASARPLHDGQLLLYVADPVNGTKLMRYRFGFRGDDGAEYFLDGSKVLHTPAAPTREQTTLYARVHAGDQHGPVWGSGVLVFRLRDVPAFVWSMRAVGVSRFEGLRRFLGFARRELAQPVG